MTCARMMMIVVFFCFILMISAGASYSFAGPLPDSCAKDAKGKYAADVEVPCKALDDFIEAFNSMDELRLAKTLNYPHVRISGGAVHVWEKPEDYAKDQDKTTLRRAVNWKETRWDYRYVVQAGMDGKTGLMKYHVALSFTRYDFDGNKIPGHTYDSFYIVTNKGGHWGTQFRSSMAGSFHGKAGY